MILISLCYFLFQIFSTKVCFATDDDDYRDHNQFDAVDCYMNVTSGCYIPLTTTPKDRYPNVEELEAFCGSIQKIYRCNTEESKKCGSEIGNIAKRLESFFSDLCNADSTIGKAYRNSSACLNQQADAHERCNRELDSRVVDHIPSQENFGERRMCYFKAAMEACSDTHYKKTCGEEASRIESTPRDIQARIHLNKCSDEDMKKARAWVDEQIV